MKNFGLVEEIIFEGDDSSRTIALNNIEKINPGKELMGGSIGDKNVVFYKHNLVLQSDELSEINVAREQAAKKHKVVTNLHMI